MADYTYANARVKALESALLSPSQVELLTTAKGVEELDTVLYDTYLAPYLKRAAEVDGLRAIDEHLHDTKALLQQIAPEPGVLDVLWLKYDYHNLKVFLKGLRSGVADDTLLADCYHEGTLEPERLLAHVRAGTLASQSRELAQTYAAAVKATAAGAVDELCNAAYFKHIQAVAEEHRGPFVQKYVQSLIDLFNVKALARGERRDAFRTRHALVAGGACPVFDTLDPRAVASAYACYGKADTWREAVKSVQGGEPVAILEKAADDAFAEWLKTQGMLGVGCATLVSYFHAVKNNAKIISTIIKATRAGMPEKDLRAILRARYL